MTTPSAELERIVGFCRYLDESCSERVFPSFLATTLLSESLPLVHDRNFLRVEDASAGANELATLADRVLGAAGLTYRRILADSSETGERLAPQFQSLGWKVGRLVVMTHSGEIEEEEVPLVAEVELEEMVPFWERENREGHPGNEELARQLTEQSVRIAEAIECRYYARRLDGDLVSSCQLYSRGATAQVESVGTLEKYRNRGLASSIVRHAVSEAFASGHDLVWLLAEEEDWPKALYARLGFAPVGRFYTFTRGTG